MFNFNSLLTAVRLCGTELYIRLLICCLLDGFGRFLSCYLIWNSIRCVHRSFLHKYCCMNVDYFQIKPNTGSAVESKYIHKLSEEENSCGNFSRRRWAHSEIQTENKTNLKRLFISPRGFLFSSAENESYRVNSCTNQSDFSPAVEVFSCWRAVLIPVI